MPGKFAKVETPVASLHSNLEQAVIQITEDRLKLCLIQHVQKIEDHKSWVAPASLLTAIVTTFVTTNFKDFGLKAPTWEAVFVVSGVLTLLWLVTCLFRIGKAPTIDDVVGSIKNEKGEAA